MRLTAIFVLFAVVAVCAVPATAGNAASDPLRLVLQRSDFPARATWSGDRYPMVDKAMAAEGFQGKTAVYAAEVALGSGRTLRVSGDVVVLANLDNARRWFARQKRESVKNLRLGKIVRLGAYGDEQVAIAELEPFAVLGVRKGNVFWSVEVVLRGSGFTSAQALTYLKTYAAKLKRRVGSGR